MRKVILIVLGAALIAGSTTDVAFSKERHHVRSAHHFNSERFRNAKAYAAPSTPPVSGYSGGMGGWESMTGFN